MGIEILNLQFFYISNTTSRGTAFIFTEDTSR